uniref:Uncharacterized protein n=1 Tax=viral metagenome TaxID=1070528 RepID=A0A6H1ZU07_9ZZZZ
MTRPNFIIKAKHLTKEELSNLESDLTTLENKYKILFSVELEQNSSSMYAILNCIKNN